MEEHQRPNQGGEGLRWQAETYNTVEPGAAFLAQCYHIANRFARAREGTVQSSRRQIQVGAVWCVMLSTQDTPCACLFPHTK